MREPTDGDSSLLHVWMTVGGRVGHQWRLFGFVRESFSTPPEEGRGLEFEDAKGFVMRFVSSLSSIVSQ